MSAVKPRLMVDGAVTPELVPPEDVGVEVLADFELLQALVAPARRATAATRKRVLGKGNSLGSVKDGAAIDADRLAGYVGGGGCAQPGDQPTHISRCAKAAGGDGVEVGLTDLSGNDAADLDLLS